MAGGIVRIGDPSTGHSPWPVNYAQTGSSDVRMNGLGIVRVGDTWSLHCDPSNHCHTGTSDQGSSTVRVNGMAIVRVGDKIGGGCGDLEAAAQGSSNGRCG